MPLDGLGHTAPRPRSVRAAGLDTGPEPRGALTKAMSAPSGLRGVEAT